MEEFPGYIIGDAIMGEEYIYPKTLWEPKINKTVRGTVYFTDLVKGVCDDAKQSIINDGGFKGNRKKYDEDEFGGEISARFSWWSVGIDNANAEKIIQDACDRGQEHSNIYDKGNKFGSNIFTENLGEMIKCYERCIEGPSEIRVLSTFKYKREIQHAVAVIPEKHEIFEDHMKFVDRDDDGEHYFTMDHIMSFADNGDDVYDYVWHPFSTVMWDNYSPFDKKRYHAHLSFAFYLDPLPGNIMLVPGVKNENQWMKCDSGFELFRPLEN